MRIIAGEARGRRLVGPRGLKTRPPTDRMKEALFSRLGDVVVDAAVLDLFAGTGSLGLEALSRGARSATFVERDREALDALRRNIAAVGLGGVVVAADVSRHVAADSERYDLVFVDPPYAMAPGVLEAFLEDVARLVVPEGVAIVHRRAGQDAPSSGSPMLTIRDSRRYGDAEVWWLDKERR